jgi:hypothetical protein
MPAPVWDWAPQRQNGKYEPGFDRRNPSLTPQWSPGENPAFPRVTEPGGVMLTRQYMQQAGMGDFYTMPQGQAPGTPVVHPDHMDESMLYSSAPPPRRVGSMAWETGPAPWEQASGGQAALSPAAAPAAISSMQAKQAVAAESKAKEAASAAKIAADNAVRAAVVGAPKVAATHAATAQAAANVAAGVATTPSTQKAAAFAQSEATKAVAAANVAKVNAENGQEGVGDFLELSGMGGLGFFGPELGGGIKLGHILVGAGVATGLYFLVRKMRG